MQTHFLTLQQSIHLNISKTHMCIFFCMASYKHENMLKPFTAVCRPNSFFLSVLKWITSGPSACPRWTHGAGCSKECDCVQEHSTGCDPKTGRCFCKAAYHGPQCEKGICTPQITNSFIQRLPRHARKEMVLIWV